MLQDELDDFLDGDIQEISDEDVNWSDELLEAYEADGKWWIYDDMINDFVYFYRYMFAFLGFGEPTEAQLEMAKFISKKADKDKLILALRGLAKSLTTQIYMCWRLLRNNNEHILVRSASSKRSRNFTTFLLNLLKQVPPLQHLAPTSSQRKSTEMFDVNGADASDSPSVYSAGVGANITGMRATIVISDDIEVPSNSATPDSRDTLMEQYNESVNLLVESDTITGEVIVLGTYQSMDSIYLRLEATGAFETFMITGFYPELNEFYLSRLAPYIIERIKSNPDIIGTAVDTRFTAEKLNKRRLRIGKSAFELQYMLNPLSSDELKFPLKLKDLIVYDIDPIDNPIRIIYSSEEKIRGFKHRGFSSDFIVAPAWSSPERSEFQYTVMSIDPSGRGADETGYSVLSLLAGKVFVRDLGGVKGGYDDESLETIIAIARKYSVNKFIIESNFGDGSFAKMIEKKLLENDYRCEIEEVRSTKQKELRIIETLEPLMNQHRIIVDKATLEKDFDRPSQYSFTFQLTHISKQKNSLVHDDIIDALELGVRSLVEYMAGGEKASIQRVEDEERNKIIERFKKGLFPHLATGLMTNSNYGARY